MRKFYRQGDVGIVEIQSIPEEAKEVDLKGKDIILAEGEVTDHAHRMSSKNVGMRVLNDLVYLKVLDTAKLLHEEHSEIRLPIGNYQVIRQREYTPERIRYVAD